MRMTSAFYGRRISSVAHSVAPRTVNASQLDQRV
jgi:hypothetical protein